MSVHITDTSAALWTIVCDEGGHQAEADPSTLNYGVAIDGSPNRDMIVIPCPVCEIVSCWPRSELPQTVQDTLAP